MLKKIKQLVNKLLYPNTYSSSAYIKYLKSKGAKIGEGTLFISPKETIVDDQKLKFIEVGNECCIARGVIILAHDWSYSVIAKAYKDAPGKQRVTRIGNNVFIGMNSIILMGADIGDNVIIGAGSVVSGKVESNSVYAGNPAKKICTLEEHYMKLKLGFEDSARIFANRFKEIEGRFPRIDEMELYKALFIDKTEENMEKYFNNSKIKFAIKEMPKKYDNIEDMFI